MKGLVAFLLFVLAPLAARADELRPVAIQFTEIADGRWALTWKQPLAGPADRDLVVPTIPANCHLLAPPRREVAALALIGRAEAECIANMAGGRIGWPALAGGGDALVRYAPRGEAVQVARLTVTEPAMTIAARPGRLAVAINYLRYGVGHILAGWDHLLFVIALTLLARRPRAVVLAATAFTLAHSLTLAGVTLGLVGLPQRPVEALIALSILFLAVELARDAPGTLARRHGWAVAFLFGLLHGFGFAGALAEIGLPQGEVPLALLTFNIGVEAGQLLVIAAVLVGRAALARWTPRAEARVLRAATFAIGTLSAFWLIGRTIG